MKRPFVETVSVTSFQKGTTESSMKYFDLKKVPSQKLNSNTLEK